MSRRPPTLLSVAYPFAPVGRDASGGSEQVLAALDSAAVGGGWRSLVMAREGSSVAGTLVPLAIPPGELTWDVRTAVWARTRDVLARVLREEAIDVVHMHGIDFADYLPPPGIPVLVTLHLPASWYPAQALRPARPDTWLVPVSHRQAADCPPSPALLAPVPNGVPVDTLQARHARRGFALVLARICPEKGIHLALDAATRAGVPCLVGGELFPYPEHLAYFEAEVRPRLQGGHRWLGPVGFVRKRRLLHAARCLLVPSLCAETSSLVAREALACGTPVVAFPAGALPEAVDDGVTGYLVDDVAGMAAAIARCARIDPATCRAVARARFDEAAMAARYLGLYRRLAGRGARDGAA